MNNNTWRKLFETISFDVDNPIDGAPKSRDPDDILMDYVEEIQDMAIRLIEMEEELKEIREEFKDEGVPYYPGFEFRQAARHLADESKFGSLNGRLMRHIQNEKEMTQLAQVFRDKLKS